MRKFDVEWFGIHNNFSSKASDVVRVELEKTNTGNGVLYIHQADGGKLFLPLDNVRNAVTVTPIED